MRKRRVPELTSDPDLEELREADSEYHGLCVDIQEPDIPVADLPLDEFAAATRRLSESVAADR